MPHQCLKCGHVFEEGSAYLLKGCPECGGNRFFFTKEPLDETQRNNIIKHSGKDINAILLDIIGNQKKELLHKSGEWINIKPKDVREAFTNHLQKKNKADGTRTGQDKPNTKLMNDDHRKELIAKILSESDRSSTPETIDIQQTGKYSIDVKGLLEKEPIVIQKDGSYTIHLPSLFRMIKTEKNR